MQLNAGMGNKRVIIQKKPGFAGETEEAKVYPHTYKKRGIEYHGFIVRGWKVGGKWQRKQFTDQAKAEHYAASVNVNLHNKGRKQWLVLTSLTESQVREAETAIEQLGKTFTLTDAVAFFTKHNRPAGFSISFKDAKGVYLEAKEREGVREPTRKKTATILKSFADHVDNADVHAVTEEDVRRYLGGLRALDGISPAKRKTFNNHRNELSAFFKWASRKDLSTNRPWLFHDPLENIPAHSSRRVAEERPEIATTSPKQVRDLFTYVMSYRDGRLVKWFALAYFAGLRPSTDDGELVKIAKRESELINITTGRIMVPADTAKTKDSRPVTISENLARWLTAYEGQEIAPKNLKNDLNHIRKKFNLQSDEARHSFISYHVALHRSIGGTALEAGNSERKIKDHYLNHHTHDEAKAFFSIVPDMKNRRAVIDTSVIPDTQSHLRAI